MRLRYRTIEQPQSGERHDVGVSKVRSGTDDHQEGVRRLQRLVLAERRLRQAIRGSKRGSQTRQHELAQKLSPTRTRRNPHTEGAKRVDTSLDGLVAAIRTGQQQDLGVDDASKIVGALCVGLQ